MKFMNVHIQKINLKSVRTLPVKGRASQMTLVLALTPQGVLGLHLHGWHSVPCILHPQHGELSPVTRGEGQTGSPTAAGLAAGRELLLPHLGREKEQEKIHPSLADLNPSIT